MIRERTEEIVGKLRDGDILEILWEVVELEGILYQKAKAEGHEIVWDENSTYFLYFGELIEEMGLEGMKDFLKGLSLGRRRELLSKVLEFNFLMASLQLENPGKEIFCASLNVSEVLMAGVGVVTK